MASSHDGDCGAHAYFYYQLIVLNLVAGF